MSRASVAGLGRISLERVPTAEKKSNDQARGVEHDADDSEVRLGYCSRPPLHWNMLTSNVLQIETTVDARDPAYPPRPTVHTPAPRAGTRETSECSADSGRPVEPEVVRTERVVT